MQSKFSAQSQVLSLILSESRSHGYVVRNQRTSTVSKQARGRVVTAQSGTASRREANLSTITGVEIEPAWEEEIPHNVAGRDSCKRFVRLVLACVISLWWGRGRWPSLRPCCVGKKGRYSTHRGYTLLNCSKHQGRQIISISTHFWVFFSFDLAS